MCGWGDFMNFNPLFTRLRRFHAPLGMLLVLLQRTPVLRVVLPGAEFALSSTVGQVLKCAFGLAAMGGYNSLAGATTFTVISKTGTATGAPTSTFQISGTVGTPINGTTGVTFSVSGAPVVPKSFGVTDDDFGGYYSDTLPPGLSVLPMSGVTAGGAPYYNTNLKLTIKGTPTDAGIYRVRLWAAKALALAGSTSEIEAGYVVANFTITDSGVVDSAPIITTQPLSQTVAAGASVSFSVAASGSPAPTFQWRKAGVAIANATKATYTMAGVSAGDAGSYTVVVTNSIGSVTSSAATLTVSAAVTGPVIVTQPLSNAAFVGGAVTISAVASGTPVLTYQWQKNGIAIGGATSASLTLSNIQLSDAGSYALVVTNAAGSVTSRFSRLVVLVSQSNAITYATTVSSTGVTAGGVVNFDYFVTNVGTKTWGANHYLSIRDINNTFVAFSSLIGILPGETTTANLNFPAPATPGTYTYYVQALENGVEFFSTQTTVILTVLAPLANAITYNTTSFPVSAAPGSNVIFTYNVTNTGTQAWGANHILSLKNGAGVTISSTPLTVLAPGLSKTVNLSFTVPSAPGTYNYTVQASQTGVGNFGTQANLTLTVLAPQPNAIVYNRVRYPDEVVPGAILNLKYTLSNAGTQAWGGTHFVSLRDSNVSFLAFVPLSGTAPRATKTMEFTLTAPTTPGTYTYYVQALEDGIEFFSTQDVVIITVVALPLGNAISYNTGTFPTTASPGATVNFTANVTNRGTRTWGTTTYLSFRDVDNTFLAFPSLSGVVPGTNRTAQLSFVAPTTPGIYTYTLQAFEDGVSFFTMADTLVLLVQ